jgi:hypothetical protein
MAAVFQQLPLTPTAEQERNARRIACLVNDPAAPKLIRSALLSLLARAAEVTRTPILYLDEGARDGELKVSPYDLAFMLYIAERHELDFERGDIVDYEGNCL